MPRYLFRCAAVWVSDCSKDVYPADLGVTAPSRDYGYVVCPFGCSTAGITQSVAACGTGGYDYATTPVCKMAAHLMGSASGAGGITIRSKSTGCADAYRTDYNSQAAPGPAVAAATVGSTTRVDVTFPRTQASGYIIDGEPLCFTDTFAGNKFADGNWTWEAPSCPVGNEAACGYSLTNNQLEFYTSTAVRESFTAVLVVPRTLGSSEIQILCRRHRTRGTPPRPEQA
jgi:hypothetical protein